MFYRGVRLGGVGGRREAERVPDSISGKCDDELRDR